MVVVSEVLRHVTSVRLEGTADVRHRARNLEGRTDLFEVFLETGKVDALPTPRWTLDHLFQSQIVPCAVGDEVASHCKRDHTPASRTPRLGIRSFTFVDVLRETRVAEAVLSLYTALSPVSRRLGADRAQQAVGKLGN